MTIDQADLSTICNIATSHIELEQGGLKMTSRQVELISKNPEDLDLNFEILELQSEKLQLLTDTCKFNAFVLENNWSRMRYSYRMVWSCYHKHNANISNSGYPL
jgi:hypothetical protein